MTDEIKARLLAIGVSEDDVRNMLRDVAVEAYRKEARKMISEAYEFIGRWTVRGILGAFIMAIAAGWCYLIIATHGFGTVTTKPN